MVKTPQFSSAGDVDLIPGQEADLTCQGCGQAPPTPHPTVVLLVAAPYKSTPVFPLHSMPWGSADLGSILPDREVMKPKKSQQAGDVCET